MLQYVSLTLITDCQSANQCRIFLLLEVVVVLVLLVLVLLVVVVYLNNYSNIV